jgi:(R,R)-butanediol dehydrogenase / meso-butanediol dehydrogenase / diacetyl reductase
MRAARYHGVRDIRLEELPDPEPGPGEVLVRVAHNGICGSDLHEYYSAPTFIPVDPHPLTGAHVPVVLGHEFSGTVVGLGDGVDPALEGRPVAVRPTYSCGECAACRRGLGNACRRLAFHGLSANGGGLSELTTLPADHVHPLPDGVSLELGALVEPMAVGHAAVRRLPLAPDDLAVVVGGGPIGIGLWFALTALGHDRVLVSETSPERRAAMTALGAKNVVDPREGSLATAAHDLSDGVGAAVVFDAAGVGAAISDSVPVLAPRGSVVVVGIHEKPFAFNPTSLLLQETSVVGSLVYSADDYDATIADMAAGRYDTAGWVDHIPLDALLDGFDDLRAGRRMKIQVDL